MSAGVLEQRRGMGLQLTNLVELQKEELDTQLVEGVLGVGAVRAVRLGEDN
jgi:hypothetical protein